MPAEKTGEVWQILGRDITRLRACTDDKTATKFGYWLALNLVQAVGGKFFIMEDDDAKP